MAQAPWWASSKSTICCGSVGKALIQRGWQRRCASAGHNNIPPPAPQVSHYQTHKPTACLPYNGNLSCSECKKALYSKKGTEVHFSLLQQKYRETRCLSIRKLSNARAQTKYYMSWFILHLFYEFSHFSQHCYQHFLKQSLSN